MNEHKGINTIGELLTRGDALAKVAVQYTNPVLIVTGAKDMYVHSSTLSKSWNEYRFDCSVTSRVKY